MIKVEELSDEIVREIKNYTDEIQESVDIAMNMVSKQLVEDIKEDSPRKTGEYAKGWTRRKYAHRAVVYNKKKPWLTAPLEYGHIIKKTGGRVAARPHIAVNTRRAEDEFYDLCETIVAEGLRLTK